MSHAAALLLFMPLVSLLSTDRRCPTRGSARCDTGRRTTLAPTGVEATRRQQAAAPQRSAAPATGAAGQIAASAALLLRVARGIGTGGGKRRGQTAHSGERRRRGGGVARGGTNSRQACKRAEGEEGKEGCTVARCQVQSAGCRVTRKRGRRVPSIGREACVLAVGVRLTVPSARVSCVPSALRRWYVQSGKQSEHATAVLESVRAAGWR